MAERKPVSRIKATVGYDFNYLGPGEKPPGLFCPSDSKKKTEANNKFKIHCHP